MSRKIFPSSIFVILIDTSENKACFHSFFIDNEMSSPGILIVSPKLSPLMLIKVFLSRYFVPEIVIPPIT